MDGFKAFKYYTALKLHFADSKFNVFLNKGRVRGSIEKFRNRNDRMLFERLARQFPDDKDYIQYVASNFMYGNPEVIYDATEAMANYKEFLRRRQSITRVFADDLDTILKSGAEYEFSGNKIPDILQLMLSKKITIETAVILNDLDGFVEKVRQSEQAALLLGDELLRVEKSKGFVKYDSYKIMNAYISFIDEVRNEVHS